MAHGPYRGGGRLADGDRPAGHHLPAASASVATREKPAWGASAGKRSRRLRRALGFDHRAQTGRQAIEVLAALSAALQKILDARAAGARTAGESRSGSDER